MNSLLYRIFIGLAILTGMVSCFSYDKNPACDKIKTGKFRIITPETEYLIDRNGAQQLETDKRLGVTHKMKVTWTGPCSYELLDVCGVHKDSSIAKNGNHTAMADEFNMPLEVFVTHVTDQYYTFSVKEGTFGYGYRDTAWFIK